jgi:pimeloyl-ACP methyl ester carboxylesterase
MVQGIRVSVLERPSSAPVSGPAIVLLHGLVAEANTFRRMMQALPPDRRIIALDLPGAGYSDRPIDTDVSFTGLANIVREVFAALDLDQPVLLGHSHGGAVALALVASHPGAMSGLVLLAPAHPFSAHENTIIHFYLSLPGRLFARSLPYVPRSLFLLAFRAMPGARDAFGYKELAPYLHTMRQPGTVPHLLRILRTWFHDMASLSTQLRQKPVPIPALVLWGARDLVVPPSTAQRLVEHLEDATVIVLPGIGHLPNDESPAECAHAINTWLEQLDRRIPVTAGPHRQSLQSQIVESQS